MCPSQNCKRFTDAVDLTAQTESETRVASLQFRVHCLYILANSFWDQIESNIKCIAKFQMK